MKSLINNGTFVQLKVYVRLVGGLDMILSWFLMTNEKLGLILSKA